MDELQLEYFLAVARMGNMTAAAASLHVAQSSISRSIARLEENMGVPLFERSGRGIALNGYGQIFYKRAETIMREMNDGKHEINELRDQHLGRVSVATSSARQINHLMMQYIEENPDVLFRQQRIKDINDVKERLNSGEIDYALTYTSIVDLEYEWTPLIEEKYYILLPQEHELSTKEKIDLKDLENVPLLINSANDAYFVEEKCKENGFTPVFSLVTDEYELLGQMVERNLGVAFVSSLGLYDMKKFLPMSHFSKICIIPITNETFKRTLGILQRKHHYLSLAAKGFSKRMIYYFKQVKLEMGEW